MKISEVAEMTNISIHTLRYYEKEGLLLNIRRNESGQRIFDKTGNSDNKCDTHG
ncbi:MerR family DNA-binding transcriptional regulator [Aeromonas veronii]